MTTKRTRANALPRWQIQTVVCSAISLTASGVAWQLSDLRRDPSGLPGAMLQLDQQSEAMGLGIGGIGHGGVSWALPLMPGSSSGAGSTRRP